MHPDSFQYSIDSFHALLAFFSIHLSSTIIFSIDASAHIMYPKNDNFCFMIPVSKEQPGLIFSSIEWLIV